LHHGLRAGTYSGGRGGGLGGAATTGALAHVLLEGIARGDGALLAQGVVLGGHRGGVLGVGLGGAAPRGVVGDVAGILGGGPGEEGGQAALRNKPRPRRRNSYLMPASVSRWPEGRDVFVLKSLGILMLQPRTRAALGRVCSSERIAHMGCGQALTAATMPESAGVAMGAIIFRGPLSRTGSSS